MFNLEESIAQWRRGMLAAGIKSPEPLEELESHLREDLERQMGSGLGAPEAFASAVQKVGGAEVLKSEFRKNERKSMKRKITTFAAVFVLLVGVSIILPVLGMWSRTGVLRPWPLLVGSALVIASGAAIYGVKARRQARGSKL